MKCPFCKHMESRVTDTRPSEDGLTTRRRRECCECEKRYTTVETVGIVVVKRSGTSEPFSRDKIVNGVKKACQGRPVNGDDLAQLAQKVEESIRELGSYRIQASKIGKAILPHLRDLDKIAYLRFASVYLDFKTIEDFEKAIQEIRETN